MERLQSNESPEQIFVKLLNESDVPCTYSHIRGVLGWLSNKWQVSRSNKEKLWPLLKENLVSYEVREREVDSDIVYVLCQVANALSDKPLREARVSLDAQTSYAVGVLALLPDPPENITRGSALEHLLNAYRQDKALDIQIALLILYEQLGYFDLRRSLLQQIVTKLAQNLNLLLKLPKPLKIDKNYCSSDEINNSISNQKLDKVAAEIERIIEEFNKGNIENAKQKLEEESSILRDIQRPEVILNRALFCILQGDLDQALKYLEQVAPKGETSPLEEWSDELKPVHQAYYQLALYMYYRLGRFQQVHNIVGRCIQQDFHPWLKTWLAYVFFASGKRQLSQELIQANRESKTKGIEVNVLEQEDILLSWYLQDTNQASPKALNEEEVKHLRQLLFQPDSSNCTQPNLSVRLFPATPTQEFDKILENALQYDVPEYALQLYEQESSLQDLVGERDYGEKLISLALCRADLEKAEAILQDYWRKTLKDNLAANLVLRFHEDFLLQPPSYLNSFLNKNHPDNSSQELNDLKQRKRNLAEKVNKLRSRPPVMLGENEYPTTNRVSQLIEEWMKASRDRELVGKKLVELLNQSPALCNLYWGRQDLRNQLWQALDQCLDYGCVSFQDIIPYYSSLEPLSDTVLHLLYVGRHQAVTELIQETRKQFKPNDAEGQYLNLLERLSQEDPSIDLHKKLFYLKTLFRLSERSPSSNVEIEEPELAISALELLVQYPDTKRQVTALLFLGELQERQAQYLRASESYRKLAFDTAKIDDASRLLAALRLMSLCVRYPKELSCPSELPKQGKSWQLLDSLDTLLGAFQSDEERENLDRVLKNLQLVIEALQDEEEYKPEPIAFLLHALPHRSEGQVFALRLYEYLVGTNPLKGKHPEEKNLKRMLYLFSEYQLANPGTQELAEGIRQTLETIVDEYKGKAEKSNLRQDIEIKNEWERLQKSLNPVQG